MRFWIMCLEDFWDAMSPKPPTTPIELTGRSWETLIDMGTQSIAFDPMNQVHHAGAASNL